MSFLHQVLPSTLIALSQKMTFPPEPSWENRIRAWDSCLKTSSSCFFSFVPPPHRQSASNPFMKKQNKTKTLQPFRDIGSISLHSLLAGVFDAIGFVYKNEQGTQRRTKNYSKDFFFYHFLVCIYFYFTVWVFCLRVSLCSTCVQCLWKPKGLHSFGTGITDGS